MTDPLPPDLVVRSQRVVTPEGIRPAAVWVRAGVVTRVTAADALDDGAAGRVVAPEVVRDVGDLVVLPGLVDSHVHVNEPGRTHWEGFATATRAAALGGVTTIVDMPLNCLPPTVDVAALEAKRAVAAPQAHVDVAFWGGAVPGNDDQLGALHDGGVRGVKAFLCDSGVPEFGCVHPTDLTALLHRIAEVGTTLLVHAEDPDVCAAAAAGIAGQDPQRHATWVASRPADAEVAAVTALVAGCRETGARVHVLHLSAAAAGAVVAEGRREGLPVTAETCPHYLTLTAEEVPDGATEFKCAPPIRGRANREALWDLLSDDVVTAVVSDHSPCPPAGKAGDFMTAWGGIASLQLGLPLVWTEAARRGHGLDRVASWMTAGPAAVAGLDRKGTLAPGQDADLVVFDPDSEWTVDGPSLAHRHPVTPHHGRRVHGRVVAAFLAGRPLVEDGHVVGPPSGVLR